MPSERELIEAVGPIVDELVAKFVATNDRSPVVSGSVIGKGGEGGRYQLANGKNFTLDLLTCRALPREYPKWKI